MTLPRVLYIILYCFSLSFLSLSLSLLHRRVWVYIILFYRFLSRVSFCVSEAGVQNASSNGLFLLPYRSAIILKMAIWNKREEETCPSRLLTIHSSLKILTVYGLCILQKDIWNDKCLRERERKKENKRYNSYNNFLLVLLVHLGLTYYRFIYSFFIHRVVYTMYIKNETNVPKYFSTNKRVYYSLSYIDSIFYSY